MGAIKEQILREFGDHGAETLERYFVQLEYTVLWCVRMLDQNSNIDAVMPEVVEDVVIARPEKYELYQVKTRVESQGPWTFNDVLSVLCQQYHRRKAFASVQCAFHFVSDGLADNKKSNAKQSEFPGSLFQFKHLLEILHGGQSLNVDEQCMWEKFQRSLIPKIQKDLRDKHNDDINEEFITELLYNTWIETDSVELSQNILDELDYVLVSDQSNCHQYTTQQLRKIHDQILLLVLRKILSTKSLKDRKITRDEVLKCRVSSNPIGNIDLEKLPGDTVLEKKVVFGGFDVTEVPIFNRQRKQADWTWRKLDTLGIGFKLDRLTTALLDLQNNSRNSVCRIKQIREKPGPQILDLVREGIPDIRQSLFPNHPDVDDLFCLGILWNETDQCTAWWHGFDDKGD